MSSRRAFFNVAVVITACSLAVAWPLQALAKIDQHAEKQSHALIVQARDAFQKGRLPEVERIAQKTRGQLLGVWPDYWRLKLSLGIPSSDARAMRSQVQQFLSRYPQHPMREQAYRDWITALLAKNMWAELPGVLNELPAGLAGPNIQCVRARLGLSPGTDPTAGAAASRFAIGQESFDACLTLIEHLAKTEHVALGYLRQRARWAAQTGSDSSHLKLMEVLAQHAKDHDLGARGPDPFKSEATLGHILKRSRVDSLGALRLYTQRVKELSHEQAMYAAFAVGSAIWRRSHADAWELMREGWSSLSQQPDDALSNAAREAIRRNAWPALLEIISAMRETSQAEPTWQYWRAVAYRETRQTDKAEPLLQGLRDDFGFYGVLARELLGAPSTIPASATVTLTAKDQSRLDKDQGMARSYALLRAGLRAEAVSEWSFAMRGRNDNELILAALHARKSGFYDRMIAAADRTQQEHDFSLRFPTPFKEAVLPAAKEQRLDPWWVLGLIRQESRFIPDVKSPVGATGLMQIMPATGKMLAKSVGMKTGGGLRLADVNTNVKLGTTYMRQLHDRFGGSALLASAAYNAGPSRAVSWRAALPKTIDGAAFAESIPFPETRDYVKRVLTNAVLYHAVHNGGTVPSLRELLGRVNPNERANNAS